MSGLPAALWLLGLFAAAPALRTSARYDFPRPPARRADPRHRDTVCARFRARALSSRVLVARSRSASRSPTLAAVAKPARAPSAGTPIPYLLIGALLAVAWPQLMRPLLEGDSLSYHLPNAASWVQAHSLWTTATRYWWYPPASELFAAGLYATSGPFALPWCGFVALALLGFRIAAWARTAFGAPPLLADALAAATVTAYPLAIQAGTLQNDVWLAAFWLESVWALLTAQSATAARALAVTALIKPQGWLFAAIALLATKAKRGLWLTTLAALALWLVHDAILWRHAIVAPASTEYGSLFGSTILAHGLRALAILARVTFAASPFASVALLAALAGPLLARREPRLGWAACAAALLFFALPFGYASSVAQLATGASLRFAAPAVAAGALILATPARRKAAIAARAARRLDALWRWIRTCDLLERRSDARRARRRAGRNRSGRLGSNAAARLAGCARIYCNRGRGRSSRGKSSGRLLRRRAARKRTRDDVLFLGRAKPSNRDRRSRLGAWNRQRALAADANPRDSRRESVRSRARSKSAARGNRAERSHRCFQSSAAGRGPRVRPRASTTTASRSSQRRARGAGYSESGG